jgi:hypothetical protein
MDTRRFAEFLLDEGTKTSKHNCGDQPTNPFNYNLAPKDYQHSKIPSTLNKLIHEITKKNINVL